MSIFSAALKRRCAAGFVLGTFATLRPFGQFLYRPVQWPSKIGLSAGAGAEVRVMAE